MTNNVKAILIKREVNGSDILFIMLGEDGSINRKGSDKIDDPDIDMFIGIMKEPIFNELRSKIDEGWPVEGASYDANVKKGAPCKLSVMFQDDQGNDIGLHFRYGSESVGPPTEFEDFVRMAVSLTDPWYSKQKETVSRASAN